MARRYQRDRPSTGPEVGRVRAIVAALVKERVVAPKSWWEILREWLRSWFSGHDEHELSWIKRWLKALSGAGGALGVVAYVLVALVVAGSLVYIVVELRSSGLFERAARRTERHAGDEGSARPVTEDDLAQASAFDQPALLLALLVATLRRSGRLTAERHLTHRELARAAALDNAAQRRRLAQLTGVAEELLYGARRPTPEAVESAIQDGRELLRELAPAVASS